jgi:hypothetical protein
VSVRHCHVTPERFLVELAVIPNASHFTFFSEPERVIPIVKHFLEKPEKRIPLATAATGYHPGETRCRRKEFRVGTHIFLIVVLKLKTSEFKILTRSHTPSSPPASREELTAIALRLQEHVNLASQQRYRLVGVGLSNFREPEEGLGQPVLFE